MAKRLIISILILIILASLAIIGYIVVGQGQIDVTKFWPLGGSSTNQPTTLPLFPTSTDILATGTTTGISTASPAGSTATGTIMSTDTPEGTITSLSLAETNALGLNLLSNGTDQLIFIDRPTGNIYSLGINNNLQRLTYSTLTGIGAVQWGKDKIGYRSLISYLDGRNINSYWGIFTLSSSTEAVALALEPTQGKIIAGASSPDRQKIFTLEANGDGTVGYLSPWSDQGKKKIWSAPVSNWLISWPQAEIISLTTKPAASIGGSLFFLNPITGNLKTVLTGISGLETLVNPLGNSVIFSRSYGGRLTLYSLDLKNDKTETIGINTLAEKCVWVDNEVIYCAVPKTIPSGLYPDDWQKGKIKFSDDIWKIDLAKKVTIMTLPLKGDYDLVNLVFSAERNTLYAINKLDNSVQALIIP